MKNSFKFSLFTLLIFALCGTASLLATAQNSVYAHEVASSNLSQSQRDARQADPVNTSKVSFPIPELGIQIEVPQNFANDFVYSVKKTQDGDLIASFTTHSLMSAGDLYCNADDAPLGTIVKTLYGISAGNSLPLDKVHVGDSWVVFFSPQATCSDNKSVQKLQGDQIDVLHAAALTAQQSAQQTNPIHSAQVDFPIPELGVSIKVSEDFGKELVYKVKKFPDQTRVYFTTKSLMAADPHAAEHAGGFSDNPLGFWSIGVISKSSVLGGRFADSPDSPLAEACIAHGDSYFYFTSPANYAFPNMEIYNLQSSQIGKLKTAFQTI